MRLGQRLIALERKGWEALVAGNGGAQTTAGISLRTPRWLSRPAFLAGRSRLSRLIRRPHGSASRSSGHRTR
jgi:hypothetical protein